MKTKLKQGSTRQIQLWTFDREPIERLGRWRQTGMLEVKTSRSASYFSILFTTRTHAQSTDFTFILESSFHIYLEHFSNEISIHDVCVLSCLSL